jgi:hypothetical protein
MLPARQSDSPLQDIKAIAICRGYLSTLEKDAKANIRNFFQDSQGNWLENVKADFQSAPRPPILLGNGARTCIKAAC